MGNHVSVILALLSEHCGTHKWLPLNRYHHEIKKEEKKKEDKDV